MYGSRLRLIAGSVAGTVLAVCLTHTCLRRLHELLVSSGAELPEGEVADVAIVLGYALFRNGSLTEPLKGRVQAGVELFLQGRARNLLFSGSHPGGAVRRRTEANVMREYAEGLLGDGPQADTSDRWFEEDKSRTTYENALYSLAVCRDKGWSSLLVVTSPFHQLRSERVFRRLVSQAARTGDGSETPIQVYVARTRFTPHAGYTGTAADRLVDLWDWARELLAVPYYYAKDRL